MANEDASPLETVSCPECDRPVPVGLPRGATLQAVVRADDEAVDGDAPRYKCRKNACDDGHPFYVCFTF